MTTVCDMAPELPSDATNNPNPPYGSRQALFGNPSFTAFNNQDPQWITNLSIVTDIPPSKFVRDIFINNHTLRFWCLQIPPTYELLRLAISAVQFIRSRTSISSANQERGIHFCFLTADWPSTWRTPTVHKTNMAEQETKPDAIAASPVPFQPGASALNAEDTNIFTPVSGEHDTTMDDANGQQPEEFLGTNENIEFLEVLIPSSPLPDVLEDVKLVLEFIISDPPAPVPAIQTEIVGMFRSSEPSELPGALAKAIARAEEVHLANLERLTALRGERVSINLHLQNIPRIYVRLTAVHERLLALVEADAQLALPFREAIKALTAKIKQQQQALTGALFNLDRMVRLYGRHILIQSFTNHFLRESSTEERVTQGRKPPMVGLSTTAFPLAEEEWPLATSASIARARSEGNARTRRQEPFALIPMPQRAFPLHCQSPRVALDGVSRYQPLKAHSIYDDHPVRLTLYGWSQSHQDAAVLEGIQKLRDLAWLRPHGLEPLSYTEEHQHPFHPTYVGCNA
jgi:hypothetical protein